MGLIERLAREVVAKRAVVVAVVATVLHFAIARGWITPGMSDRLQADLATALDAAAAVVGVLWARAGVTPADPTLTPTDNEGRKLRPVRTGGVISGGSPHIVGE